MLGCCNSMTKHDKEHFSKRALERLLLQGRWSKDALPYSSALLLQLKTLDIIYKTKL